jgi:hypothetical protein
VIREAFAGSATLLVLARDQLTGINQLLIGLLRRVSKVPATALTPQRLLTALTPQRLLLRYHFLLFFNLISRGSGRLLRLGTLHFDPIAAGGLMSYGR